MARIEFTHDGAAGAPPAVRRSASGHGVRLLTPTALILYALALALGLGLWSAYWALKGDYPFGSKRVGPWTVWPRVGSRETDPYARAVIARTGDVPLGVGEGLLLTASADEEGRPLEARCAYRIGMTTPQTRLWTLTLYDGDRPVVTDLMRSGFTSAEVLRDADGRAMIVLSRDVQPGNWLRMPETGRVSLALRLYETSAAVGSAAVDQRALPSIARLGCAP